MKQWRFVFPDDREKLTKYFKREISSDVYIRLMRVTKKGTEPQLFFQVSGDDEPYTSVKVSSKALEDTIRRDFPFIRVEYCGDETRFTDAFNGR